MTLKLLVAVVLSSLVASATVVVHESIDAMAARVPLIVRGRVARTVSGWDTHKRRIWTWTEVVVTQTIKGKVASLVLLKQPGGDVDGISQTVAGAATFQEGEDCVLFLDAAPDEPGTFRPSGLSAGKVILTSWRGQPAAIRHTEGLSFALPHGAPVAAVVSPEFLGSPESFIRRITVAGKTQ